MQIHNEPLLCKSCYPDRHQDHTNAFQARSPHPQVKSQAAVLGMAREIHGLDFQGRCTTITGKDIERGMTRDLCTTDLRDFSLFWGKKGAYFTHTHTEACIFFPVVLLLVLPMGNGEIVGDALSLMRFPEEKVLNWKEEGKK